MVVVVVVVMLQVVCDTVVCHTSGVELCSVQAVCTARDCGVVRRDCVVSAEVCILHNELCFAGVLALSGSLCFVTGDPWSQLVRPC